MTQFTSFVAVEETVVTEGGTPRRIDVPVEMPHGMSYEGVFGERNQPSPSAMAMRGRCTGGSRVVSSSGSKMAAAPRSRCSVSSRKSRQSSSRRESRSVAAQSESGKVRVQDLAERLVAGDDRCAQGPWRGGRDEGAIRQAGHCDHRFAKAARGSEADPGPLYRAVHLIRNPGRVKHSLPAPPFALGFPIPNETHRTSVQPDRPVLRSAGRIGSDPAFSARGRERVRRPRLCRVDRRLVSEIFPDVQALDHVDTNRPGSGLHRS